MNGELRLHPLNFLGAVFGETTAQVAQGFRLALVTGRGKSRKRHYVGKLAVLSDLLKTQTTVQIAAALYAQADGKQPRLADSWQRIYAVTAFFVGFADDLTPLQYAQQIAATGGTPPYTWTVSNGALPDGLGLNASSGVISGTPTSAGTSRTACSSVSIST